ncbi:EF-hand-like domain-containing protein [Variovorax paradoxus B4]|uniref:EF-hand domain-containing protein n=2 Tax=Variovorax paradoxus TaxID=34073 RepID=A0A0H2LSA5_VARPD|nr:hypothetical protein [Variovorax paradoxus]AGU49991.1 EF-hand-like domain-containing protein [Variovorax paradoxus B4]KLN52581.1 hypothetical protein VPARA_62850 [Variovorax paradoxus]
MKTRCTWLLVLAASSFAACAQTADASRTAQLRTELHKRFAAADSNTDGRLTRDEARGKMPRVYRDFDAIDSTRAGAVTMAQIEAYAAARPRSGRRP